MPLVLDGKEITGDFADEIIDGRKFKIQKTSLLPNTPDTMWKAWWEAGEWGTRADTTLPGMLVGHWTAGEAGTDTAQDDGPRVVGVMKRRPSLKQPGYRMQVAVDFVIGAEVSPGKALVWQTADPVTTATFSVGSRTVNTRAVAVEVVNKGLGLPMAGRFRPYVRHPVATVKNLKQLAFQPGQLIAWIRLANLLATHLPIQRQVPGVLRETGMDFRAARFLRKMERTWSGGLEHFHVHSTTKVDAGSQLMRALTMPAYFGLNEKSWDLVEP